MWFTIFDFNTGSSWNKLTHKCADSVFISKSLESLDFFRVVIFARFVMCCFVILPSGFFLFSQTHTLGVGTFHFFVCFVCCWVYVLNMINLVLFFIFIFENYFSFPFSICWVAFEHELELLLLFWLFLPTKHVSVIQPSLEKDEI